MITSFKDLVAYREAHKLVLAIYAETKHFPAEEKFALVNQMQRAAVSITSNIAEGFARNTAKDKVQFYTIARGSLFELDSQLLISRDLGYIHALKYEDFVNQIELVSKLISGLIKSAPSNNSSSASAY